MIKVLKEGIDPKTLRDQPKEIECWQCKSLLEYTDNDTKTGQYAMGCIIVCPVCKAYVDV